MTYDRWDVALSLFPFTDKAAAKARPVAVLSPASFNAEHGMVVAAMITSAAARRLPTDHALADLASPGLRTPSVVRWKIMTLDLGVMSGRIGTIGEADRAALIDQIAHILPIGTSAAR